MCINSYDNYVNSAIVQNIERSLAQVGRDGEFGVLSALYHHDEFTLFLQKIIELQSLYDPLTSVELREKIRLSLEIQEPLLTKVTDRMIEEAIKHLKWADVIYPIPNSDEVIFTQPGLRYSQLENEMETLKNTKELLQCSSEVRNFIYDKLESDIKGRMLEDIIYYQLVKDKEIADRYNIFKYKTIVNTKDIERHKEIAIVIMSKKNK